MEWALPHVGLNSSKQDKSGISAADQRGGV